MRLKHIDSCRDYFNYGALDDMIMAESFSWNEDEQIELLQVSEYIKYNSTKTHMYLITSKICEYPVSTIDKYLKLWKGIRKEYDFRTLNERERKIELRRFYIYVGFAEFFHEQLDVALEILQNDFRHSCIILSDEEINIKEGLDRAVKISRQKTDYTIKFADLINSVHNQNEVVTSIIGYNGRTINYFYLLNK